MLHTAASVQEFQAAKGIKTICQPPYLLDLTLLDFFLFLRVKLALAGQDSFPRAGRVFLNYGRHLCRKITQNKFLITFMLLVFLPCAFDSDQTSHT
jgi:hypothetical protein